MDYGIQSPRLRGKAFLTRWFGKNLLWDYGWDTSADLKIRVYGLKYKGEGLW